MIWKGRGWNVEVLFSRAGLSTVILVNIEHGSYLLLDCGDGCTRDLVQKALKQKKHYPFIKKPSGILISHDHFDHVGGLHTLLGYLRMIGCDDDLEIVSPKGSLADEILISGFAKTYPDSIPFRMVQKKVSGGEELNIAGIRIEPFPVIHCGSTRKGGIGKPKPAMGYKLAYSGEKVVYTGDCGLASALEQHIEGADLLLIEATLKEPGEEIEERVHLSIQSARKLSKLAKKAFLIHCT